MGQDSWSDVRKSPMMSDRQREDFCKRWDEARNRLLATARPEKKSTKTSVLSGRSFS